MTLTLIKLQQNTSILCSSILWIMRFYSYDLDTQTWPRYIYVCTENEVLSFNSSKVLTWRIHRHTDSTEIITYLHTRMVIIKLSEEYSHNDKNYRSMVMDMRKICFLFAASILLVLHAISIAVVDLYFPEFSPTTQHTKTVGMIIPLLRVNAVYTWINLRFVFHNFTNEL